MPSDFPAQGAPQERPGGLTATKTPGQAAAPRSGRDPQESLAKQALSYSGLNLVSQAISFVSNFILRRIIPPEVLGVWNLAQVVRNYAAAIGVGVVAGAARRIPILRGRGDEDAERRCRSAALTMSILEAAILGAIVAAYALVRSGSSPRDWTLALLATAAILVQARLQDAYVPFLQGHQAYSQLSQALLVNNTILALGLLFGAWTGGLGGLLLSCIAAETLRAWLLYRANVEAGLSTPCSWDWEATRGLLAFGLKFKATDYPNVFFMSLDLLYVSKVLGFRELAIYSLAKSIFMQAMDVTVRLGTVLATHTLSQVGQGIHRTKIASDMRRFLLFQAFIAVPLVSLGVAIVVFPMIRHVIPVYHDAIPALGWLLMSGFFTLQNTNLASAWIGEERLLPYGLCNAAGVAAVAGALAALHLLSRGVTVEGVAQCWTAGVACYFLVLMATAGYELWGRGAWALAAEVLCAAAYSRVSIAIVEAVPRGLPLAADLRMTLRLACWALLFAAPLVAIGLRVTGLAGYLASIPESSRWKRIIRPA